VRLPKSSKVLGETSGRHNGQCVQLDEQPVKRDEQLGLHARQLVNFPRLLCRHDEPSVKQAELFVKTNEQPVALNGLFVALTRRLVTFCRVLVASEKQLCSSTKQCGVDDEQLVPLAGHRSEPPMPLIVSERPLGELDEPFVLSDEHFLQSLGRVACNMRTTA